MGAFNNPESRAPKSTALELQDPLGRRAHTGEKVILAREAPRAHRGPLARTVRRGLKAHKALMGKKAHMVHPACEDQQARKGTAGMLHRKGCKVPKATKVIPDPAGWKVRSASKGSEVFRGHKARKVRKVRLLP